MKFRNKEVMGKNRLKWGFLMRKKHKVFLQKKCLQQRLYEHILDQRLCPLNGGVPSLVLFKLYINQYVESWTVNLRRINTYYYLECSDLHWLNYAAMFLDIHR